METIDPNSLWKSFDVEEIRTSLREISVERLTELLVSSPFRKGGKFTQWIDWQLSHLHEFHIEADIQRLIELGINKETLGLAMFLISMAPALDHFLKDMFGDKRTRRKNARSLGTAASILEAMNKILPDSPDMMALGIPGIGATAKGIRSYSSMLVWGEAIYGFVGANSLLEVVKYALAGLVKNRTGKFHDREVSALTGAALQEYAYDETRHRVWRIRTHRRLEESFPLAPKLLHAFDNELSRKERSFGTSISL